MNNEQTPEKRRPGRVKNPELRSTTVMLPERQIEWAVKQPGGLATILRECLKERYRAAQQQDT